MDIDRTGMRLTPQPVQPAESLRERPHAARLRDEVLRIDIGAHLQRLRGDHDQMTVTAGRGLARGCHAVHRIENPRPGPLRLSFPGTAGQQQDLSRSVRGQLTQTPECLPRTRGRVGEHHACRRRGRLLDQVERGLGQPLPDVAGVEDAHLCRLHRVQSLPHDLVRLVVSVEIESRCSAGIAGCRQRHDARP